MLGKCILLMDDFFRSATLVIASVKSEWFCWDLPMTLSGPPPQLIISCFRSVTCNA